NWLALEPGPCATLTRPCANLSALAQRKPDLAASTLSCFLLLLQLHRKTWFFRHGAGVAGLEGRINKTLMEGKPHVGPFSQSQRKDRHRQPHHSHHHPDQERDCPYRDRCPVRRPGRSRGDPSPAAGVRGAGVHRLEPMTE